MRTPPAADGTFKRGEEAITEACFARGRLREGTEPDAANADVQQALELAPEPAAFLGG